MFRLIKPQEIAIVLFLAILVTGYFVEEKYPLLAPIILGVYGGMMIGGLWTDTTNKWILIKNSSIYSDDLEINGEPYKRKNIFYVWLAFRLTYIAFILLGVYVGWYCLFWFISNTVEFSWYVKVFYALVCGLLVTLLSIAPLLIFEFLEKRVRNKFICKYKNIFKQLKDI